MNVNGMAALTEQEQAALYRAGTQMPEIKQDEDNAIDDLFATLVPDDYEYPVRECCGVSDDESFDVDTVIRCAYGNCDVLYCRCGRSTESGYGSVGCRCQLEAPAHWRVFERKMISVRRAALSTRKKRSRTRGA